MAENNPQRDPFESMLAELQEAERAGVFRSSAVPTAERGLVQSPRFWVPLAAAALLAFGVWGLMFAQQIRDIRTWMAKAPTMPAETVAVAFSDCMDGPGFGRNAGCSTFDFDSDGDVDLADYSRSQLTEAASNH